MNVIARKYKLEIPVKVGKLYVSAIFDYYHLEVLGMAMDANMRTELCIKTLADVHNKDPELHGATFNQTVADSIPATIIVLP